MPVHQLDRLTDQDTLGNAAGCLDPANDCLLWADWLPDDLVTSGALCGYLNRTEEY
jgi:hypothetical protein